MKLLLWLRSLLFPEKCVLCQSLLEKQETDLCSKCRVEVEEAPRSHNKLPYLDRWASVWYYEDTVRHSILRFKFHSIRYYAAAYGRLLAIRLEKEELTDFDILSYVPVSSRRRWLRGYDQSELIARAIGRELGRATTPVLKKIRNTPPQSGIVGVAQRRANVLGAYRIISPTAVRQKQILLIDDVITTGATAGECARILRSAGAKCVNCAAVARRRDL